MVVLETFDHWLEAIVWTLIGVMFIDLCFTKKSDLNKENIREWFTSNTLGAAKSISLVFVLGKLGSFGMTFVGDQFGFDLSGIVNTIEEHNLSTSQVYLAIAIVFQLWLKFKK